VCHPSVFAFFGAELSRSDIEGRRILEVGSRDVNGSVRPFVMSLGARDYLGVDMEPGSGVDRLCDVTSLATVFADDPFDVVLTTEMLEHVRDWKSAISNLKRVVAPRGMLIITTRSFGFPYHDFPGDYWRYELDDMQEIFRDFQILKLIPDPQAPGVFLKCRKPEDFREIDTSRLRLFSVVKAERSDASALSDQEVLNYAKRVKALRGVGGGSALVLRRVDLADVGQRDFRNLWRSFERLSDQMEGHTLGSERPRLFSPWPRRIERLKRRLLDLLTAAGLARGRLFAHVRRALLRSAGSTIPTTSLRVPWGRVEDEPFREIVSTLESIQVLCAKIQSYARPSRPA
jgi:SAM-dependent methyltransferase